MITNTVLLRQHFYYPLGNTPAESLTKDLPPEQDADILLLSCGDAKNVLFTCFADPGRKLDVTCNDIQPGIHARNILLYTLLIDDKKNANIEQIWNIHYHWKLDNKSVELLEKQTQKLLNISKSIEQWNSSVYGTSIRWCDERSRSFVRSYWTGYLVQGLPNAEKVKRKEQMQAAINRAQVLRGRGVVHCDMRAVHPIVDSEALLDLHKIAMEWWYHGTTSSSNKSSLKATELNPTYMYSPNHDVLTPHYCMSPVVCFPLSTAYFPIPKGSVFHIDRKGSSSKERLVDCAKSHFAQWASAFRRAVGNKSVIRILCSDPLAACCTLRHCLLALPKRTATVNLFCDNWTSSPLVFHHSDYIDDEIAAPLSFDVIDASNLLDFFGPLNVIGVASSLLKFNGSSSLYAEMLMQYDGNITDRLSAAFGVDVRTMSMLLGLVIPDFFTNAADSVQDDLQLMMIKESTVNRTSKGVTMQRSRFKWRRSRGCPYINVEAETLARFLIQVYRMMFEYENLDAIEELESKGEIVKHSNPAYNRASFAMLMNILKSTVVSDWNRCVVLIYKAMDTEDPGAPLWLTYNYDLIVMMHMFGVDDGLLLIPHPITLFGAVLLPTFPPSLRGEGVPKYFCVTVQVAREKLEIFTSRDPKEIGCPALVLGFQGADPDDDWLNFFSSVQITFGKWHPQTKEDGSYPYIEEDISQLSGKSDLFVSAFVPTFMLLKAKKNPPWVQCCVKTTPHNSKVFSFLGNNLLFACNKITDKNVFITRYMPGMTGYPAFLSNQERKDKPRSALTTARLLENGSKIETLIQRLALDCPKAKENLSNPSSAVDVKFKSPLIALVNIAKCQEQVEFPIPVSPSKYKVRIARKSSYIEIESPLFNPFVEHKGSFLFPTFMTETPGGATAPMPWTSSRVDLDAMPPIDLKDKKTVAWLQSHFFLMFSERELQIREPRRGEIVKGVDVRIDLKDELFSIFQYYIGFECPKQEFFGLNKVGGSSRQGIQTLFFPDCLRLDLVNHSIVLDAAMIPLTLTMLKSMKVHQFLHEMTDSNAFCAVQVSEDDNRAWKAMMPALVERCRTATTWKHVPSCEYIQTGKVPLSRGLNKDGILPICSCGIGQFSPDYLTNSIKRLPHLKYMIKNYGTRVAISPIFGVPYVEGTYLLERLNNCAISENCSNCGKSKRDSDPKGEEVLLVCSRCRKVKYCSKECQRADWKNHKAVCSTA